MRSPVGKRLLYIVVRIFIIQNNWKNSDTDPRPLLPLNYPADASASMTKRVHSGTTQCSGNLDKIKINYWGNISNTPPHLLRYCYLIYLSALRVIYCAILIFLLNTFYHIVFFIFLLLLLLHKAVIWSLDHCKTTYK